MKGATYSTSHRSLLNSRFLSILCPNILLRILSSFTLSLSSSLNVKYHVSQLHSTLDNTIVYIIKYSKSWKKVNKMKVSGRLPVFTVWNLLLGCGWWSRPPDMGVT